MPAIDFTQPVAISNELTISDKTKSVSKHIEKLKDEQNYIYKKEQSIASLLKVLKLKQFDDSYANTDELVKKLVNDVTFLAAPLASPSPSADLLLRLALLYKYQRLNKHRLHLRSKVSNLKKELSCLRSDCKRHDFSCH